MSHLRMETVNNVTEFLSNIADCSSDDIRTFAEDAGICETQEEVKILEAFLSFRETLEASFVSEAPKAEVPQIQTQEITTPFTPDLESWKWLLDTAQVEQRTQEWYAESRNALTASEVSKVFKKNRTRDQLIVTKSQPIQEPVIRRLAVERASTSPMDWGVRYEPLVKAYLEKSLKCKIQDLGRIRHRAHNNIAASPDGLFISCELYPELIGRLVEIKCPTTRIIKEDSISFDYSSQMQLQMEVCDRPSCEFVEAKFRQPKDDADRHEDALDRGWITLISNIHTDENRYLYHHTPSVSIVDPDWASVETYEWELAFIQRVTVKRGPTWFQDSLPHFAEFWKDVQAARDGTWQIAPGKERKRKDTSDSLTLTKCGIVEEEEEPMPPMPPMPPIT
jgi:putative phage-type endonuclease